MEIIRASEQKHFFDLRQVRVEVFVVGQNVPIGIELDSYDREAIHLVAYEGEEVLGTVRLVKTDRGGKIGRMAVYKQHQGKKIGKKLMDAIEKIALDEGINLIYLSSQHQVESFYHKCGFESIGSYYYEANIKHVYMEKKLK
jgi:predicted GNAT family N-acyltransferase